MSSEFQQTRDYITGLVEDGYSFNDIKHGKESDKRALLISIYISELNAIDSLFEDQQPSRNIISRFLEHIFQIRNERIFLPKNEKLHESYRKTARTLFESSTHALANEVTDCILNAHEHYLSGLFEVIEDQLAEENGEINEREEFLRADNRERYRDMTWPY